MGEGNTMGCFAHPGVPVVLEQKTTIFWKCLHLLASLKDSSGLGVTDETKRSSEEENLVHRQNTTVNVDIIRCFRPPYVWMKTFVFPHSLIVKGRIAVVCMPATGTPIQKMASFLAILGGALR
jgi:hypothetical protein